MKYVRIGDTQISACAVAARNGGFLSAVTIVHRREGRAGGIASHHEWDEPLFESEAEALRFAWRRAVLMAQSLTGAHG